MSRKPRIKIVTNDDAGDWHHAIAHARLFLCYVSPKSLRDSLLWEQLAYAKEIQRPVRAFIEEGTHVPIGFFAGIDDCVTHVVSSVEDLTAITIQYAELAILEEDVDA